VRIEEIARLAGHSSTRTTEVVYRKELRAVITTGAEIMGKTAQRTASRPPLPSGRPGRYREVECYLLVTMISATAAAATASSAIRRAV
jgi:hypothetical protein